MIKNLPNDYSHNLSNLTPEQRAAIEEDKQRWFKAHQLLKGSKPVEIRRWITEQANDDYRADMKRRLNVMSGR